MVDINNNEFNFLNKESLFSKDFSKVKPQFEFLWEDNIQNKVIVACRGGGKTVAVMQFILEWIIEQPGLVIGFFGKDFATLEETIREVCEFYFKYWEENSLCNIHINRIKHFYEFDFGDQKNRRIWFGSYTKGEDNRGPHPHALIIDEAGLLPENLFYRVIQPMISQMGFHGKVIFLGTANGHNTFYKFFKLGLDEKNDRWKSYMFKGSDSGLLDQKYLAKLREEIPEDIYRQEYECDFEVSAGAGYVYTKDIFEAEEDGRINNDVIYNSQYPVYAAMDLGRGDYTTCWMFQPTGTSVNFIDYHQGNGCHISAHCADIASKNYPIRRTFIPIDATFEKIDTISTVEQTISNFDLRPLVLDSARVWPAVLATKHKFKNFRFNKNKCAVGIENLKSFRVKLDRMFEQTSGIQIHESPYVDTADALRYAVQSEKFWSINRQIEIL